MAFNGPFSIPVWKNFHIFNWYPFAKPVDPTFEPEDFFLPRSGRKDIGIETLPVGEDLVVAEEEEYLAALTAKPITEEEAIELRWVSVDDIEDGTPTTLFSDINPEVTVATDTVQIDLGTDPDEEDHLIFMKVWNEIEQEETNFWPANSTSKKKPLKKVAKAVAKKATKKKPLKKPKKK